ncbi:MAG: hypothetical protein GY715_18390 [Planctomycetes bacterium]|nr:hypothetical protein [Planctomycetota bacterium]
MRIRSGDHDDHETAAETAPVDGDAGTSPASTPRKADPFVLTGLPVSTEPVQAAIDDMSRRIQDLARELNCLGYFDDDDRPRAA